MFSDLVLDHTWRPRNVGQLEGATHHGLAGLPEGGPYVHIWLTIQDGMIERATYQTYGCPAAIACASVLVEKILKNSVRFASDTTRDVLECWIGELPEGKHDCIDRSIEALRSALANPIGDTP